MASPQSGAACNVELPDPPSDAVDADVADPGTAADPLESALAGEDASSANSSDEDESEESHWVAIELKDEDGNPVPGEAYKIKLPDGTIIDGRLDEEGKAKIERLAEGGKCEVTFPKIHKEEVSQ